MTELAVFEFINGQLTLTEIAEGYDLDTIKAKTRAEFVVLPNLKTMSLAGIRSLL